MKETSLPKQIFTSLATLLIASVVVIAIAVGLGIIGVPLWPFILFVFFFASAEGFKMEKLKYTAISGAIGIFIGMAQGIISQVTGSSIIGLICFIALVLVFCTAFIMGNVPWSNVFGILVMTIMTLFSLEPCVWAGIATQADMGWMEAFVRVIVSYGLAVLVFIAVGAAMKRKAPAASTEE